MRNMPEDRVDIASCQVCGKHLPGGNICEPCVVAKFGPKPLVKGGQGRTDADMRNTLFAIVAVLAVGFIGGLGAGLVFLCWK